jgi:hypothetical protein
MELLNWVEDGQDARGIEAMGTGKSGCARGSFNGGRAANCFAGVT